MIDAAWQWDALKSAWDPHANRLLDLSEISG